MTSTFETICDRLRDHINDPSIAFGEGEAARHKKDQIDRVVFVHKGGQNEDATWNGPKRVAANGRIVQFYPAYDDVMQVEAHITGSSRARWEEIRRKVLNATKDLFGTNSTPGTYAIATEAEKAGNVHAGKTKGVHAFKWRVSIGRERTHQLGLEANAQLSPSLPVTELVMIHQVEFTYQILPSAPL